MARFENCIDFVLKHEGGYTVDHAGATNYGVTLPVLRKMGDAGDIDHDGDIDAEDIAAMSRADACAVYQQQWWDAFDYERFHMDTIARKVLDMAVNMGQSQAIKLLQRACNALSIPPNALVVDGKLGPKTMKMANYVPPDSLLRELRSQMAAFYRRVVHKHPEYNKYIRGWLHRAEA